MGGGLPGAGVGGVGVGSRLLATRTPRISTLGSCLALLTALTPPSNYLEKSIDRYWVWFNLDLS